MARHKVTTTSCSSCGGNHWGPWGPGQGSPGPWGPGPNYRSGPWDSNYDLRSFGAPGPRPKPASFGPRHEPWEPSPWNGRPPRY